MRVLPFTHTAKPTFHAHCPPLSGTAALELAQYCEQIGVETLDDFLVCTGGGGLTAGCATVLSKLMPACRLYSVEPEAYDDHVSYK